MAHGIGAGGGGSLLELARHLATPRVMQEAAALVQRAAHKPKNTTRLALPTQRTRKRRRARKHVKRLAASFLAVATHAHRAAASQRADQRAKFLGGGGFGDLMGMMDGGGGGGLGDLMGMMGGGGGGGMARGMIKSQVGEMLGLDISDGLIDELFALVAEGTSCAGKTVDNLGLGDMGCVDEIMAKMGKSHAEGGIDILQLLDACERHGITESQIAGLTSQYGIDLDQVKNGDYSSFEGFMGGDDDDELTDCPAMNTCLEAVPEDQHNCGSVANCRDQTDLSACDADERYRIDVFIDDGSTQLAFCCSSLCVRLVSFLESRFAQVERGCPFDDDDHSDDDHDDADIQAALEAAGYGGAAYSIGGTSYGGSGPAPAPGPTTTTTTTTQACVNHVMTPTDPPECIAAAVAAHGSSCSNLQEISSGAYGPGFQACDMSCLQSIWNYCPCLNDWAGCGSTTTDTTTGIELNEYGSSWMGFAGPYVDPTDPGAIIPTLYPPASSYAAPYGNGCGNPDIPPCLCTCTGMSPSCFIIASCRTTSETMYMSGSTPETKNKTGIHAKFTQTVGR